MPKEKTVGQGNGWVKVLLVAGVAIAAPRLMGAFGQLLGRDVLTMYPWFAEFEVITGGALAVLEGLALAHIADRWRRFAITSPYWWILAVIQVGLLLTLPFVSTVYLVAAQFDTPANEILTWRHIWSNHLVWLWSYLGAAISTVIVMGVGIVHNVDNEGQGEKNKDDYYPKGNNGRISVAEKARFWAGYYHEATPDEFSRLFEDETGLGLTVAEAEAALAEARTVAGRNGKGRK